MINRFEEMAAPQMEMSRAKIPEAEYPTLTAWAKSSDGKNAIRAGRIDIDRIIRVRGESEELAWILSGILEKRPVAMIQDASGKLNRELGISSNQMLGALVTDHFRWEWQHARDAAEEADSSDASKWASALSQLSRVTWGVSVGRMGSETVEILLSPRPTIKSILDGVGL